MKEMIAELMALLSDIPDRKSSLTGEPMAYGWHNPRFPPEYRRACLRRDPFEPDIYTEIYALMADWYERVSGGRAPCDFSVYREWKERIRSYDGSEKKLTAEEKERIICAIEIGTRHRKADRDPAAILRILKGTEE